MEWGIAVQGCDQRVFPYQSDSKGNGWGNGNGDCRWYTGIFPFWPGTVFGRGKKCCELARRQGSCADLQFFWRKRHGLYYYGISGGNGCQANPSGAGEPCGLWMGQTCDPYGPAHFAGSS